MKLHFCVDERKSVMNKKRTFTAKNDDYADAQYNFKLLNTYLFQVLNYSHSI